MTRYIAAVSVTNHYDIEVEARDEFEATEIAASIPIEEIEKQEAYDYTRTVHDVTKQSGEGDPTSSPQQTA